MRYGRLQRLIEVQHSRVILCFTSTGIVGSFGKELHIAADSSIAVVEDRHTVVDNSTVSSTERGNSTAAVVSNNTAEGSSTVALDSSTVVESG